MKTSALRVWLKCLMILTVSAGMMAIGRAQQVGGEPSARSHWVGTWAASAQAIDAPTMPPVPPGLTDTTLRQIVHVSIGGKQLRVRFSNAFGAYDDGLKIDAAHVALSSGGATIKEGTDRALTFHKQTSVTIPRGALMVSDPLDFELAPGSDLAVTIHVQNAPTKEVTGHRSSRCDVYLQAGSAVSAVGLPAAVVVKTWYYLSGVDVPAPTDSAALVCLGDSITDGKGSTEGTNRRWPDLLALRLRSNAATSNVGVLNQGIGGGALWRGGIGQPALVRLARDVFAQPGARWLIVLEGINDLGGGKTSADELIVAYQQIIFQAHDEGLRVYGATLLPCGGSGYFKPELETARQTINAWIRGSNAFDAVIDFDAATRDPHDPTKLISAADSGDHLHPSDEGHRLMAEAVALKLFR